jgi:DNA-binding transcriptional ArsR family regulator
MMEFRRMSKSSGTPPPAARSTPPPAPRPAAAAIDPAAGPVASIKITDLETIRVMSDPLRIRILQGMAADSAEPWTVKRLAASLGLPATKLYYHVNLLEKHGLVRVTQTAIVSGIVESRYAIAARRFEVDRSVFATSGDAADDALAGLIATVFDSSRDEVLSGISDGRISTGDADPDDWRRLTLTKSGLRVSPARAAEFRARIEAVLADFEDDAEPDGYNLATVVAIYPVEP